MSNFSIVVNLTAHLKLLISHQAHSREAHLKRSSSQVTVEAHLKRSSSQTSSSQSEAHLDTLTRSIFVNSISGDKKTVEHSSPHITLSIHQV